MTARKKIIFSIFFIFSKKTTYCCRARRLPVRPSCLLACLLRILALREVKESKLLLAFGQCIMKLLGLNIIFETETNFENLNERKRMKDVC